MDAPHIDDLVAQVLAWHNHHRLAHRIAAHQVSGIGVVALPFAPQAAPVSPGRSRALSWRAGARRLFKTRTDAQPLTELAAAFSEDFIAPLARNCIARFALRHGSAERPGDPDWPQRDVRADAEGLTASLSVLFLRTVCIEQGERRRRLLLSPTSPLRVLGSPIWSRPRIAVASLALSTCAAMAAAGSPDTPDVATLRSTAAVDRAAPKRSEPALALPKTLTPKATVAPAAVVLPVSMPASSSPNTAPFDLASRLPLKAGPGHSRPNIRPLLSDDERVAALQVGKRLRSMEPAAVAALARSMQPVESASAKTPAKSMAPADAIAAYALVTDITRTRIASELRQQLIGSNATVGELPGTPHAELMQVGTGWRAVVWPFATQIEADKARRMLAERGIRTELLKF